MAVALTCNFGTSTPAFAGAPLLMAVGVALTGVPVPLQQVMTICSHDHVRYSGRSCFEITHVYGRVHGPMIWQV